MKIKILSDADDTLCYNNFLFLQYINHKHNLNLNADDILHYDFSDISHSELEKKYFFEEVCEYTLYNLESFPLRENAKEVIEYFHKNDIGFSIATARSLKMRHKTEMWLHKNFNFNITVYHVKDDIHMKQFANSSKANLASLLGYKYFIEDNPEYLTEALNYPDVTPICFSCPWNESLKQEGIVRVNSWLEIKDYIIEREGISP